jgi:hypothetical protein
MSRSERALDDFWIPTRLLDTDSANTRTEFKRLMGTDGYL